MAPPPSSPPPPSPPCSPRAAAPPPPQSPPPPPPPPPPMPMAKLGRQRSTDSAAGSATVPTNVVSDRARVLSHRRQRSDLATDGSSSSFSSPLPPCPDDPPVPPPPSCTPPQYQIQDDEEDDDHHGDEDNAPLDSSVSEPSEPPTDQRSVETHGDDADTEDMDADLREEAQDAAAPTPPPPPSPPSAPLPVAPSTTGFSSAPSPPPPPPPPPLSPPSVESVPTETKTTASDGQVRVVDENQNPTYSSNTSSIASMRTAASNREIMALDVAKEPAQEKPRWYIGDIESYTIIDKVGSGTYGEVFKCQHKVTKDIVALKKLRSDVEKNGFPVTSIREMKILKHLKHPNVVSLKEIVSSSAPPKEGKRPPLYFAFEYLEHDLSGLLNHPKVKFTRTQIQCYMRQLLCGVAFMHRNKIIHRDIKASNLLLNNQGMLKIADFGLSRFWNEVNAKAGRYTNKVVTLWYRSPELLLGSTSYDFSVDMWSIGCIFAELLLGRPIFPGNTEIEQLNLVFSMVGPPTEDNWSGFKKLPGAKDLVLKESYACRLKERFKGFPPHTVDLLEKMLTLDPTKRITAAEAMDHDYFWRVITCKPRDLPKFGVASSHEYQSKKRHQEEMAAAAAQRGEHQRNVRPRHREHHRAHHNDKNGSHHQGQSGHSNYGHRGRQYRHRDGDYHDRDREPDRHRERDRSRERDREHVRGRSRERDDRHHHVHHSQSRHLDDAR